MTLGPGDRGLPAASRGYLRASDSDREQMIDTLKAVYAAGRLAKDDFDARIGQVLAARTYAELAAVTAGLPVGPVGRPAARAQSVPAGEQRSPVGRIRARYASHSCYRFRAEFPAR